MKLRPCSCDRQRSRLARQILRMLVACFGSGRRRPTDCRSAAATARESVARLEHPRRGWRRLQRSSWAAVQDARRFFGAGFAGSAEMTERRRSFTDSEDLNTDATSGSSTTTTESCAIRVAKRLGLASEYSRRYSALISALALPDALLMISTLVRCCLPR